MFKYFGGKVYLLPQLIRNYPTGYSTFVDVFGGSGEVLCQSPRCSNEYLNDVNPDLVSIYRTVQNSPDEFISRLRRIEYTQENYAKWRTYVPTCEIETAIKTLIRYRWSRSGIPDGGFSLRLTARAGWSGNGDECRAWWLRTIMQFAVYSIRLRGVQLSCESYITLIPKLDSPDTFFYLDPPYVKSSRVAGEYDREFTNQNHIALCKLLTSVKGKVMLSGYGNPIYRHYLAGWREVLLDSYNRSSHAKKLRKSDERIWINY